MFTLGHATRSEYSIGAAAPVMDAFRWNAPGVLWNGVEPNRKKTMPNFMIDPLTIFNAAVGVAGLGLRLIEIFKGKPSKQKQEAARTLVLAIAATEEYLDTHDPDGDSDPEQERRLRNLWNDASKAVFPLDNEVSYRLSVKSDYWRNPKRWTKKQIKDAGIRLRDVRSAAIKFL